MELKDLVGKMAIRTQKARGLSLIHISEPTRP